MESSAESGQSPQPPINILPTPLFFQNIFFFKCDFFSPLAPFLCLTCIPSPNRYGWLDNFTGSLTPKGTPERGEPGSSFAPLLIQPAAPPRPLSKLCKPRCFSYPNCTAAAFQCAALVDVHWCMEHIYELVISYCSAHSSNSVCQTGPLPYSQTICLTLLLSSSLSLSVCISDTLTRAHTHTHIYYSPTPQWVAHLYKYWNSGTARVPAESTFHFAMPSSQNNCSPFFCLCSRECAAGSLNCLRKSVFILSGNDTTVQKKHKIRKKKNVHLKHHTCSRNLDLLFLRLQIVFTSLVPAFEHSFNGFPAFVKSSRDVIALFCRQVWHEIRKRGLLAEDKESISRRSGNLRLPGREPCG